MGEIYYIKVKALSLIIYCSDKLVTIYVVMVISKSRKGDFLGLVFVFLRISSLG